MTVLEQLTAAVGGERGRKAADRLCEACVELFDVDGAAISLVLDGAPTGTLGASGSKARLYDELQFTYGEGPCLEASLDENIKHDSDLTIAPTWPRFAARLLDLRFRR